MIQSQWEYRISDLECLDLTLIIDIKDFQPNKTPVLLADHQRLHYVRGLEPDLGPKSLV